MIKKLPWDSDFFGFTIGSCEGSALEGGTQEFEKEFGDGNFDCVYVFCGEKDSIQKQFVTGLHPNVLAVDGHVEYELSQKNQRTKDSPSSVGGKYIVIGEKERDEANILTEIELLSEDLASVSRFSADPAFRPNARKMYKIWMDNILKDDKGLVVMNLIDNQVAGVVASQLKGVTGVIELVKVKPGFEGMGIGRGLVNYTIDSFFKEGVEKISVKTQIENEPARHLYEKCGFSLVHSTKIYHWWK